MVETFYYSSFAKLKIYRDIFLALMDLQNKKCLNKLMNVEQRFKKYNNYK
jgi:hypothetical protein